MIELGSPSGILLCHFCNNPITKMNGHDSDSLLMHHLSYVPEVKVPAHRGCDTRYHKTHPDHPTNPETEYRKKFIKNLGDDTTCHFCGEEIQGMLGRAPESLIIHSLDGDHDNWDPENKVPTHRGCHASYHMFGDNNPAKRPEVRKLLSKAKIGKYLGVVRSDEVRRNISDGIARTWPDRKRKYGASGGNDRAADTRRERDPDSAWATELWKRRRELYGPSGFKEGRGPTKRPEVSKAIGDANRGNSDIGIKGWEKRRELYGPSGRRKV